MSIHISKPEFGGHIYRGLMDRATLGGQETDGMRLLQMLAGITVETLQLFDQPDDGLEATYAKLADLLGCEPSGGELALDALPPAYNIDLETESGRELAKHLFEDWLDCAYAFHDLIIYITHNVFLKLEQENQPREEIFRLFIEITNRAMAFEIASQELCDVMIDEMVFQNNWSFGDSVSGLSAVAGRYLALSPSMEPVSLGEKLNQVANVMTQEAIRLGVPAGSDWHFGLAANDRTMSAPHELINVLEPACSRLFDVMGIDNLLDRSVACAKAAGRMLAVAAGGETPEIEPVIAKPLAMAAMTETYMILCHNREAVSL